MTSQGHKELNDAVRHATAFPDWRRMREAMEGGYLPTLRDDYGDWEHKDAIRVIRLHMVATGWSYFDGSKVIG